MVAPPAVLRREMGCTRAEFLRWLPGATRAAACSIDGNDIALTLPWGSVRITLTALPPRTIGALTLPVLGVEIAFNGADALERTRFLEHLDLYTRRGGG
ncbi:MAG: hypothetical protein ABI920_04670 [Casimicrobiaceae bacterium]